MLSFWEKRSFVQYDYIVIGGGIVGLSTAIELKQSNPEASVLVLERGLFPSGASTKNAGFACFGSLTELLADIESMGADATLQLLMDRWSGLQKLRKRLGEKNIDFHCYGGYELIRENELPALEKLDEVNDLLWPVFNALVFSEENEQIKEFGFPKKQVKALIRNQYEGQIDTGKMMKSLAAFAGQVGVEVLTGADVSEIEEGPDGVILYVVNPFNQETMTFKAGKVGICTNAFTNKIYPNYDVKPGRGIVLVTKPIKNLRFKGVFHFDEGYYYFRNFKNRVIFGGGRNLDIDAETTTEFAINEVIEQNLKKELNDLILPKNKFEIDHTWSGIMAFGRNKQPILEHYSDRIVMGVRLGGMGVAIGSNLGEKVARMMLETTVESA